MKTVIQNKDEANEIATKLLDCVREIKKLKVLEEQYKTALLDQDFAEKFQNDFFIVMKTQPAMRQKIDFPSMLEEVAKISDEMPRILSDIQKKHTKEISIKASVKVITRKKEK